MYETYIPGFTGELLGGTPGTVSATGTQTQPTAQPVQTASYSAMPSGYSQTLQDAAMRAYNQAATRSFGATGELSPRLERIDTSTDFNYSPTAAQQYWDANQYLSNQQTGYDLSHSMIGATTDPRTGAAMPLTNAQVEQLAATPLQNQFYANFNPGTENWASGNLQFDPASQYRLIDRTTGNVLYTGTGYDAGQNITNLASGLMDKSGNKANWAIETAAPNSTDWMQRYEHVPDANGFGTFLSLALPMAGGAILGPMLPGLLGVSAPVGTGIATGLGTAAAGTINGKSFGDILLSSALSGLAAGGLSALTTPGVSPSSVGDGATGALGSTGGIGATGGSFAGTDALGSFIQVPGRIVSSIPGSVLGGALGAASGAMSGTNYGDRVWGEQQAGQAPQTFEEAFGPGWEVLAPTSGGAIAPATGAVVGGALGGSNIPEGTGPDIVVNAGPNQPVTNAESQIGVGVPPITSVDIPPLAGTELPDTGGGLSTMDYIRLASLGISTLGKLFGGNGSGSGATISGNMGGLNPVFNKQLPGANMPGLTAGTTSARAPSQSGLNTQQDWYRYGYGPEQSFFNSVPLQQPNTSQAYTGYEPNTAQRLRQQLGLPPQGFAEGGSTGYGYSEGGDSRYVEGPGDGRDDQIPAMLSDGEYVFDAETVALLGNGSNKAGADRLDKFRVNIRKHKGQRLAKGEISADAKGPEHYMAGGRM